MSDPLSIILISAFGPYTGTWKAFFEIYTRGDMFFGDCIDWIMSWWQHRSRANVHIVFYEDILKSPREEIQKMADYLGQPVSPTKLEAIKKAIELDSMKGMDKWGSLE